MTRTAAGRRNRRCESQGQQRSLPGDGDVHRLIDEWTGHATDEQRKRYWHLYPSTQQEAILSVFGQ